MAIPLLTTQISGSQKWIRFSMERSVIKIRNWFLQPICNQVKQNFGEGDDKV